MRQITRRHLLISGALVPFANMVLARYGCRNAMAATGGSKAGYFPNVLLHTHENQQIRFYDDLIRGKCVMINMLYASCEGICPLMTANLARVQQLLGERVGRDIFMYSLTLKPGQDTPEVLKTYAEMHGVGPGWWFLTGEPGDIELLRRKLGFVDPDPIIDADPQQHSGVVLYGNEVLDRWAACPALTKPEQIVRFLLSINS